MSIKIIIQWQDQFGKWQQYQTVHHEGNAYQIPLCQES
jgi:hypothetical protein